MRSKILDIIFRVHGTMDDSGRVEKITDVTVFDKTYEVYACENNYGGGIYVKNNEKIIFFNELNSDVRDEIIQCILITMAKDFYEEKSGSKFRREVYDKIFSESNTTYQKALSDFLHENTSDKRREKIYLYMEKAKNCYEILSEIIDKAVSYYIHGNYCIGDTLIEYACKIAPNLKEEISKELFRRAIKNGWNKETIQEEKK